MVWLIAVKGPGQIDAPSIFFLVGTLFSTTVPLFYLTDTSSDVLV